MNYLYEVVITQRDIWNELELTKTGEFVIYTDRFRMEGKVEAEF